MNKQSTWPAWVSSLILSVTFLLSLPGFAAQLYVATSGCDTNSGTRAKPFATLERARDEVRELRKHGRLADGGVTIWLRGGDYLRTRALELTTADSGTPKGSIIWRAFKGERVRLLGGRKLTAFETVTDAAMLAIKQIMAIDPLTTITVFGNSEVAAQSGKTKAQAIVHGT